MMVVNPDGSSLAEVLGLPVNEADSIAKDFSDYCEEHSDAFYALLEKGMMIGMQCKDNGLSLDDAIEESKKVADECTAYSKEHFSIPVTLPKMYLLVREHTTNEELSKLLAVELSTRLHLMMVDINNQLGEKAEMMKKANELKSLLGGLGGLGGF